MKNLQHSMYSKNSIYAKKFHSFKGLDCLHVAFSRNENPALWCSSYPNNKLISSSWPRRINVINWN